jgi:hypothetical protein
MQTWTIAAGAAALALSLSFGAAQAATPSPRSAISAQCSKEADAKGLHGKARRHFRSDCKRAAAKSSQPGSSQPGMPSGTTSGSGANSPQQAH